MKKQSRLVILLAVILIAGCKTIDSATGNVQHTVTLYIQSNGDTYNKVLDLMNEQTHIQCTRIIDESFFFGYYQRMEVEIDFLNSKKLSSLQIELLRIPGIISVSVL